MEGLPQSLSVFLVALLSALAGALITWMTMHVTGARRNQTTPQPPREEAGTADLLRVEQTKAGPVVVVRGQRVRDLHQIKDRETGEKTIAAIKAVLDFAEGWLPALRDQQNRSVAPTRAALTTEHAKFSSPTRRGGSFAPGEGVGSTLTGHLELVAEVDALLQKRLQERPELAGQGVRLTQDVDGRLLIYVGQQRYHSTEEIPDDEVSTFIQRTIKMWESR